MITPLWKPIVAVAVIAGGVWGFLAWRDNLIETSEKRGFGQAQAQYVTAIEAANKIVESDNKALDRMDTFFNMLAFQREQGVTLTLNPISERIQNEVAADSRYRDCAVSAGVLDQINAARAAVDTAVSASNPAQDR